MDTTLDCIPCLLRQALEAARFASPDPVVHERVLRQVLRSAADMDSRQPPPLFARDIHRLLRDLTGVKDPYAQAKERFNRLALDMLPELAFRVEQAPDPLAAAVRLAIAGNTIDLGANGGLTEAEARQALSEALRQPFAGDMEAFARAAARARDILYLADNAGEIVLDGLLIRQLGPDRVTLVVRGGPIINDATMADARATGLTDLVHVMDNGSDAPGTVLDDCGPELVERLGRADLIIAKGQGNFETLNRNPAPLVFLFKVKCPVIAARVGQPVGRHVLALSSGPHGPAQAQEPTAVKGRSKDLDDGPRPEHSGSGPKK